MATFTTISQLREFKKAFEANSQGVTDVQSLSDGRALSMVGVENTMVSMTATQEALKFLNKMERKPVNNVVSMFNILEGYGDNGEGSFVSEMANAQLKDAEITRERAVIKFMAEAYRVSKVLSEETTIEDPELVQMNASIMRILFSAANDIWYGDESINPYSWNGFYKTAELAGNVVDAEGEVPAISLFKELATEIQISTSIGKIIGGLADTAYMPLAIKAVIENYFVNSKEFVIPSNAPQGNYANIGYFIPGLIGAPLKDGKLQFETDLPMRNYNKGVPTVRNPAWISNHALPKYIEGKTHELAPDPCTFTATNTGATISGSKWKSGDVVDVNAAASKVGYRVVAGNEYGRSQASVIVLSSANLVAGHGVNLSITPAATGEPTTYFEIYRETTPGNGDYKFVTKVKNIGSPTAYQDINNYRPGTDIIVMGQFDSQPNSMQRTYAMYELLPMVQTKFPQTVANQRTLNGMVEWYASLVINAPKKFWVIKNVPAKI